jgi:hypothetical protein
MRTANPGGTRTAPGVKGHEAQLLDFECPIMAESLRMLLQLICDAAYIPDQWHQILLVLLGKPGREGEPMHKANRPIAMSNFLLKALDSLLLARKRQCMEKEGCDIDPAIMAYRKGIGREMALFVISESVLSKQWQAEEGGTPIPQIILLLLDVQHAFNGVNRKHLEVQQWDNHGIQGQLWLLSTLLT